MRNAIEGNHLKNLDQCFGPMISEFLGIFSSFHRILRYGKLFAFIYKDPAISTRLFPIPRYLEQKEICLGFGHKYKCIYHGIRNPLGYYVTIGSLAGALVHSYFN